MEMLRNTLAMKKSIDLRLKYKNYDLERDTKKTEPFFGKWN